MRITFEPGDGAFEVLLDQDEQLPPEWNKKGVTVLRESTVVPGAVVWVKDIQTILPSEDL